MKRYSLHMPGIASNYCSHGDEIIGFTSSELEEFRKEVERRGEERGFMAAREQEINRLGPGYTGKVVGGLTKRKYKSLDDWRNSEEYKNGKAEVEG